MTALPTRTTIGSRRITGRLAALACMACTALAPVGATAQPASVIGQAISISFVEMQTVASTPARTMAQKNAVVLTLRSLDQIEFERERNPGSISKAHTYGLGSGAGGSWLRINNNSRIRVILGPKEIVVEQHIFNFTQRYVIVANGKTCSATISYALDPGQSPAGFELLEILTKKPLKLASLAAANVSCSLGTTAIY